MTEPAVTLVYTRSHDMSMRSHRIDFPTAVAAERWLDRRGDNVEVSERRDYTDAPVEFVASPAIRARIAQLRAELDRARELVALGECHQLEADWISEQLADAAVAH
jgi:hypothetical protein